MVWGTHKSRITFRVFIGHRRSEKIPATTQNSPAKFRSFPERALLFHNNSSVTLHYSPALQFLTKTLSIINKREKIGTLFSFEINNPLLIKFLGRGANESTIINKTAKNKAT